MLALFVGGTLLDDITGFTNMIRTGPLPVINHYDSVYNFGKLDWISLWSGFR